ncbi:MAG: hypothetical protein AABY22_02595 [Nanoarchaeota archaeon]
MKKQLKLVGKKALYFGSKYAYPILNGRACEIVNDWGKKEVYRFGIKFPNDSRSIAATESEVRVIE